MACCCNCKNCCKRKETCNNCRIRPVSGCPANSDCAWYPLKEECGKNREMRICCDENGCCGMYPADCRNQFWPDFAHPRWLCCRNLYCAARHCCR